MISNKGFECIKQLHTYIQLSRTFSVTTQPLFFKSTGNNYIRKRSDHDYTFKMNDNADEFGRKDFDDGFERNDFGDDFRGNNRAGKFERRDYADKFGTNDYDKKFERNDYGDDLKRNDHAGKFERRDYSGNFRRSEYDDKFGKNEYAGKFERRDYTGNFRRSEYDDKFGKNKYAGKLCRNEYSDKRNNYVDKFKNNSYADTFGTLDENSSRMYEYKEDPDDIEELQRQRNVTYKPMNLHIQDIKCHLGRHDYKKALEVLEVDILKNERRRPNRYIFDLLLSYCGRKGDLKEAYRLYLMLKKRNYPIAGGNYTSFFNAAALCPRRELALERIRKVTEDLMTSTFHQPNVTNYNAMIKAYARHGDMDMCLKIMDAVRAERGSVPIETYNHLLQACVSDKNSGFRHAISIWHKMIRKKAKPDHYTFNLMLRCVRECSLGPVELLDSFVREILSYNKQEKQTLMERKTTDLPEDVELLEDQKSEEFGESESKEIEVKSSSELELGNGQVFSSSLPNLLLRNPVLGSIVKLNRISTPQDRFLLIGGLPGFFKLLSDYNVEPDHKMISQVLDVIPNNLEAEEEYIKLLEEKNIPISTDFVNVLLKRRIFRREKKEHIKGTLKLLQLYSCTPDIFTYGTFALSCDTLEEAEDFLILLKDAGVSLNTPMWNALLLGALKNSDLNYAKAMIQVGKKEEVQPDWISVKYLKRILQNSGGRISKPNYDNENFEGDESRESEGYDSESYEEENRRETKKNDLHRNQKSSLEEELKLKTWDSEPYREEVGNESGSVDQKSSLEEELKLKTWDSEPYREEVGNESGSVDDLGLNEKLNLGEKSKPKSKAKAKRKTSKADTESIKKDAVEQLQSLNLESYTENNSELDKLLDVESVEKLEEESKSKTKKRKKKTSKVDSKSSEGDSVSEGNVLKSESYHEDMSYKENPEVNEKDLKPESSSIEEVNSETEELAIKENEELVSEFLSKKLKSESESEKISTPESDEQPNEEELKPKTKKSRKKTKNVS